MHAVVAQLPSRIVVEPAEFVAEAVLVVRHCRGGAEIEVPVDSRRRTGIGRAPDAVRVFVSDARGACDCDVSDCTGPDEVGCLLAVARRPAMDARLHDSIGPPGGFDHATAFVNCQRKWLLDVHVLARVAGVDHHQGVPMVGRCDDDGIDIGPRNQVSVISDEGGRRPGDLGGVFHVVAADVADGDDLLVGVLLGGSQKRRAAVADSDEAESHSVVRPADPLVGKGRQGRGLRESSAGCHVQVRAPSVAHGTSHPDAEGSGASAVDPRAIALGGPRPLRHRRRFRGDLRCLTASEPAPAAQRVRRWKPPSTSSTCPAE